MANISATPHGSAHGVDDHEHHGTNNVFGFWVYLMTDCLVFGTLFATFAVMRTQFNGGPTGKELFDLNGVGLETALLLFSSITFGFGMLSAFARKQGAMLVWLAITFVLGLGFLVLEVKEFAHLIHEGAGPDRSAFLSAFFTLVATHGLHVTCGLIWIVVIMAQSFSSQVFTTRYMDKLQCLSLFWHFLDIVWICVFTFVYLLSVI